MPLSKEPKTGAFESTAGSHVDRLMPKDGREWFEITCKTGIYPVQIQADNSFADYIVPPKLVFVSANNPKMQAFNIGGISYKGDKIVTGQNSREIDLNMRQQKNLFDSINNNELGNNGTTEITNIICLDGLIITKSTTKYINNKAVLITNRGVA